MPPDSAALLHQAQSLADQIARAAPAIAAQIKPPFSAATRNRIAQHLARTQGMRHQLAMLCNQAMAQPPTIAAVIPFQRHRLHLSLWLETETIIANLRPQPRKPPRLPPGNEAQLMVYERSFYHLQRFFDADSAQAETENADGRHSDIPLPFTRFLTLALLARRVARAMGRDGPLGFLDVGCGGGLKLLQASGAFEVTTGLEYDTARADAARTLMRQKAQIITGDAMTFTDYALFDVIYAYKPLYDPEMMIFTERRILSQARPGTVLIMPYSEFEDRHTGYDCAQIEGPVYVTGLSPAQLASTRRHLPMIGHCLPAQRSRDEGFAKPLRDALRRWGHLG